MSVILVVEQDASYAQRIASTLQHLGHQVDVVADVASATARATAGGEHLLLLASGVLPGALELLSRFSKRRGGPGAVVLLPIALADGGDPGAYHADYILPKPFSDETLQRLVDRLIAGGPTVTNPMARGPAEQLTSADIFADVLAEVEAAEGPGKQPGAGAAGTRRRPVTDAEIDRKLEETLSGFFPDKPKPRPEAPPSPVKPKRQRKAPSADEIDDLLDKTLSSLELPGLARRGRASTASPRPSEASTPAAPSPPSPTVSPPAPLAASGPSAATPVAPASPPPASPTPASPPPVSAPIGVAAPNPEPVAPSTAPVASTTAPPPITPTPSEPLPTSAPAPQSVSAPRPEPSAEPVWTPSTTPTVPPTPSTLATTSNPPAPPEPSTPVVPMEAPPLGSPPTLGETSLPAGGTFDTGMDFGSDSATEPGPPALTSPAPTSPAPTSPAPGSPFEQPLLDSSSGQVGSPSPTPTPQTPPPPPLPGMAAPGALSPSAIPNALETVQLPALPDSPPGGNGGAPTFGMESAEPMEPGFGADTSEAGWQPLDTEPATDAVAGSSPVAFDDADDIAQGAFGISDDSDDDFAVSFATSSDPPGAGFTSPAPVSPPAGSSMPEYPSSFAPPDPDSFSIGDSFGDTGFDGAGLASENNGFANEPPMMAPPVAAATEGFVPPTPSAEPGPISEFSSSWSTGTDFTETDSPAPSDAAPGFDAQAAFGSDASVEPVPSAFATHQVEALEDPGKAAGDNAAGDNAVADFGWGTTLPDDLPAESPMAGSPVTEPPVAEPPVAEPAPSTWGADPPDASHPADFATAFAHDEGTAAPLPTAGAPPADPSGALHDALEGVLQIRGHEESPKLAEDDGVPFGDYRLLERVAVGGMAEVWRARRRGVEGFQKTVAIKRILSHLTGSSDFVTMFVDEAKLAAQLNHANIIQIYDLGKVDDDFYIAMEFVDGLDLRSILNRSNESHRPIPLALGLSIVAALARALDYAHRKKDFDNRALGLVHRDVSPQNVLISYEGEIKLCDFGIVKAVAKASTTQMGALKGKLQYMSPEQAWGKEVDARSDIFSLGSVMFEILTGSRLFTGDSEIGVLDAVRDCRIRSPREVDPTIPVEAERILFRALAATPEERYPTAGEMERDLVALLESTKPTPGQAEMAAFMQSLFGREAPPSPMAAAAAAPASVPLPDSPEGAASPDAPAPAAETPPVTESSGKSSKAKLLLIALIIIAALVAVGLIVVQTMGPESASPPGGAAAPAVEGTSDEPAAEPREASADEGSASAADAGEPAEPGSSTEDSSGADIAPAEGADPEAPEVEATSDGADPEGEDGAANPADVERMINDAVSSEQERLEAEFEARKRQLEAELQRVKEDEASSEGGGGDG